MNEKTLIAGDEKSVRPAANSSVRAKRILVVDDDAQILESLGKVLRGEGYEVELAADGQEALKKFNESQINLVLLDLNLPRTAGWDIFGHITADDPFLPVVIITGRHNQQKFALEAGVAAFMEKPLNVPRLLRVIAKLMAEEPLANLKRLVGAHRVEGFDIPAS